MAKKTPSLYSISKTFFWFAITSIVLTGSLVAIVLLDSKREWKDYQKSFLKLKLEKSKAELKEAESRIDKAVLDDLSRKHAEAVAAVDAHRNELGQLRKQSAAFDARIAKIKARYQTLKQFQDSYRYYYEETREHHDPAAARYQEKIQKLAPTLEKTKSELDSLEKSKEANEARVAEFTAKEKELQKAIDKALEEKTRAEKRIQTLRPSLAKNILNAPMLDFIAPSLKVQQIVLENLQDDYHFAQVQKVDRCTTCHLGIDQKGFENAPQPFRTHPKLDLFLASSSAHPIEKVGCTVCHGGNGHSVSFKDSAHMPHDDKQAAEWKKKYHWEQLEKWDHKMLPLQHVEAACAKCHQNVVSVPQAERLNKGRRLAEEMGCFNCHKIGGFSAIGTDNRWKVGPSLERVGSKVTEEWLIRWLHNPKEFRPATHMPRIFHLSNTDSPEDRAKDTAAIEGIAAYLLKNSDAVALNKPPVAGSTERGEKLVKTLGCLGCHSLTGVEAGRRAPELSSLGSKVTSEWLYTWLKDPKHYSKDTRMPNLRLSDQEAADITEFLLSEHNEAFDKAEPARADAAVVDDLILESLKGTLSDADAKAELARMSADEKKLYLGKKSISHQGCFACHTIKGFEDAKPIGTELSTEGSKDLHQFDFGFVHDIEHTRDAWIHRKLKDPRGFDKGKVKSYYEKLRMPQFDFTDEEADSLTTFLLSLTNERIPLEMRRRLSIDDEEAERGRLLVAKLNCYGCHELDGQKGLLREMSSDNPGAAPPVLDGEGAKVQEQWLDGFLKHPTTIRPWLEVRMPTFGFTDEETDTLVRYFDHLAHQEISYRPTAMPVAPAETMAAGHELFDKLQCVKCHQLTTETAAMGASFLAPDLLLSKHRLKPEWVRQWIEDPQILQAGTMMPTFFTDGQSPLPDILEGDAKKQIEAIRDYLYAYQGAAAPSPEEDAKKAIAKEQSGG